MSALTRRPPPSSPTRSRPGRRPRSRSPAPTWTGSPRSTARCTRSSTSTPRGRSPRRGPPTSAGRPGPCLAARRRADRGQGRARHRGPADHVRVEDPRGLGPAVRRDRRPQAPRSRPADPRQDQHGRVRDGLLDRALRLRPHPQPVGPRPDPRRLRRRLGRGGRRVRGAAGDRHRHRRLDPPARRGHRDGRRQADVRRGVALRPGRAGQLPGPGRPGDPHGAGLGAAARGDRRPRPAGLHVDRPAAAGPGRGRPAGCRRRPLRSARRRGHRARRATAGSPA